MQEVLVVDIPLVCAECGRRGFDGVDARFCSICGCPLDPFDVDEKRAIEKVRRDLTQTVGATLDRPIEDFARNVKRFTSSIEDFESRLVHEVQQVVHDYHIDTSWPPCPLHPNHPLWFEGGWWRCEAVSKRLFELGSLPRLETKE